MKILGNRVLVARIPKEKKEGFTEVDVQDDFVYRGKVVEIGELEVMQVPRKADVGQYFNAETKVKVGDTVLFAKYSPDTHDVKIGDETFKSVAIADILVIE